MSALVAIAFLLGAAPAPAPAPAPARPELSSLKGLKSFLPQAKLHAPVVGTACAGCHVTESWSEVRFNHDKTGFPLRGRHERAACKACHPVDFEKPVARACATCHRDPHGAELGARCEACHDEQRWRALFNADAHRKNRFPLLGGHAVIPCHDCHLEFGERRFAGAPVDCGTCHQRDLARTVGAPVDHVALGFTAACEQCHGAFTFAGARFPAHDLCFPISSGPHAQIGCGTCHQGFPPPNTNGACNTRTATCTKTCHDQCLPGSNTEKLHAAVLGYQCKDRKCYECHQLGGVIR